MCLAIPYKIKSINGKMAIAKVGKESKEIDIHLISKAKQGDWILVSQGFAVSKISKKDALKSTKLANEVKGVR